MATTDARRAALSATTGLSNHSADLWENPRSRQGRSLAHQRDFRTARDTGLVDYEHHLTSVALVCVPPGVVLVECVDGSPGWFAVVRERGAVPGVRSGFPRRAGELPIAARPRRRNRRAAWWCRCSPAPAPRPCSAGSVRRRSGAARPDGRRSALPPRDAVDRRPLPWRTRRLAGVGIGGPGWRSARGPSVWWRASVGRSRPAATTQVQVSVGRGWPRRGWQVRTCRPRPSRLRRRGTRLRACRRPRCGACGRA